MILFKDDKKLSSCCGWCTDIGLDNSHIINVFTFLHWRLRPTFIISPKIHQAVVSRHGNLVIRDVSCRSKKTFHQWTTCFLFVYVEPSAFLYTLYENHKRTHKALVRTAKSKNIYHKGLNFLWFFLNLSSMCNIFLELRTRCYVRATHSIRYMCPFNNAIKILYC